MLNIWHKYNLTTFYAPIFKTGRIMVYLTLEWKIEISPKKYTDHKTINSNNYAKFEVNWPRGSQFTARHTKNRLQFDE
jgi:hypothetical protein